MSPMLFFLFIEDLELLIQDSPTSGLTIDDITFILLLFADDMVLFGKTPEELQHSLDLLETYCDSWGLDVNIKTTKLMVCGKSVQIHEHENWIFKGKLVEIVNDFNYLGSFSLPLSLPPPLSLSLSL